MEFFLKFFSIQFLCIIFMTKISSGEVFTAMTDVSRLLTTEGEMIRTIENYITAQEERLGKLKRDLLEMEKVHDMAAKAPETFLANPLNAYLLIKRLTIDWADLQSVINIDPVGQSMLSNLTNMTGMLSFPTEEDLNGVALALMRLQDTYKLETSELAQGSVLGMNAYRELTAGDCFELGRQSYNSGEFHHTLKWMNEALKKHAKEANCTVDHFEILEYLAFSTYKEGNIRQALKLTNDLLDEKPDHERGIGNKAYYEKVLFQDTAKSRGETEGVIDVDEAVKKGYTVKEKSNPLDSWQQERATYERLCRGEGGLSQKMIKRLVCLYQYGPSPFLRLARVKAEIVHFDPTITIYHDVLYDSEIENVKQLATPRFQRATVQNYKTGELEVASYRISKSAWLKTDESQHVSNINKRIETITGLNLETAEELQVANYGIGGHYEPHFDYARREEKDAFKNLGTGNRIATVLFYSNKDDDDIANGILEGRGDRLATFLFYMSDVQAGGGTVFPRLELTLTPKKGAAAFWYNLHPNGEGDELTRHAACPVLVGQKWVSNKWIHERGQEFRTPCLVNFDAVHSTSPAQ